MTLDEKILRDAQKLPPSLQEELFEFAQYLLMKAEQKEKQDWYALSLASAMHGIQDEPALYSSDDLKETFS
jgi:hypothetical protein